MNRAPGLPPSNYQQKLLLGPGGHWYLNGMPVYLANEKQQWLPGVTRQTPQLKAPQLKTEHFIGAGDQNYDDSDYDPEEKKKSSTLEYLSSQWSVTDDDDEDGVPVQGMVNESFSGYKPKTDVEFEAGKDGWGRDIKPSRMRGLSDQTIGSNQNNANAGYGNKQNRPHGKEIREMVADPTFGKFRDRSEDNKIATVPYFILRLITGIIALLGSGILVLLCIKLNTFHMLWRMTFDGMQGKMFLLMIPLLLTGGISGICSRFSENLSVLASSCYLIVAIMAYAISDGNPVMMAFLVVYGISSFLNLFSFFERFEGTQKRSK